MKLNSRISNPDNVVVTNSHYVGDIQLFLQNDEKDICNMMDILELYCVVLGSKIAYAKIYLFVVQNGPIRYWLPQDWKKIKHKEIMRYLGIPFGIKLSLLDMWNWYINIINNKIFNWGNKFLSLAGKIEVNNFYFFYNTCLLFLSLDTLKKGV